jgi:hypothetical protein
MNDENDQVNTQYANDSRFVAQDAFKIIEDCVHDFAVVMIYLNRTRENYQNCCWHNCQHPFPKDFQGFYNIAIDDKSGQ